ncbi:MAG TPA: STAS domain-containing protein [Verrucomicrobiae bacterium]|jgi:anti-anti-sigma regulatory factor|nr:STAS domain-containing protein [Verrucomicrobiae bacterium]
MNTASARLLVFASGRLACIKIAGRANFTSSLDFKLLIHELSDKAVIRFVLDLSECVLMDSTFLGVLAGFGLEMSKSQNGQSIELMDATPRIVELLENLGVLHLFKVITSPCPDLPNDGATPMAVPGTHATREEITRTCLEAHKTLMEIDAANIPKFKEVAQFLAEDLKKLKGNSGT